MIASTRTAPSNANVTVVAFGDDEFADLAASETVPLLPLCGCGGGVGDVGVCARGVDFDERADVAFWIEGNLAYADYLERKVEIDFGTF